MVHPLAGVFEKLRRANVHIVVLHHEIGTYLNTYPYRLVCHRDTGDGTPGFTFHITEQPPLRVSCIIGDILHNIRSALDYIARALILSNGGTPGNRTQFPLCSTEHDFRNESVGLKRLEGISERAWKRIAACQPYRFGADKYWFHPLWQLQKLSNIDKHRTLALSAIGAACVCIFKHPDGRVFRSEVKNALVHDGAVIGSMPADFFDDKIKTDLKVTCQVSFTDAPVTDLEVVNILHNLNEFVGDFVIPLIEPFFDPLPDGLRPEFYGLAPSLIAATARPGANRLRDALPTAPRS